MKKYTTLFLFLVICLTTFGLEINSAKKQVANNLFIENKGQIVDQNGQLNSSVLFLLNNNGLNVQIHKTGFSYDTYTIEKKLKVTKVEVDSKDLPSQPIDSFDVIYHYHRVDISFVGANSNPTISSSEASSDYTNYYNVPVAPEGILNVRSYSSILVKDIYPGIDIEYLVDKANGFKYNFIVHPGADYSQIKLQFLGAPTKQVSSGIEMNVDAGIIKEEIPKSWYENGTKNNEAVNISFKSFGNGVYGFKGVDAENKLNRLVIDPNPTRLWGTYVGGSSNELSPVVKLDLSGNVYLSALTNSSTNIATSGAHQTTWVALYDLCLIKFNSSGARLWGTYYGGSNDENDINSYHSTSLKIAPSGNLYVAGITTSTSNISTAGSHQVALASSTDLYLVKFNNNGVRLWGTYYGGTGAEKSPSCALDVNENVYLAGSTLSNSGISTVGSHQSTIYSTAVADNFIVKFNLNGVRQWATYYGGNGSEINGLCATDPTGNIYFVGTTNSTINIATTGSHQSAISIGFDNYIVKFNTNGVRQWGTYYGGEQNESYSDFTADLNGNLCLVSTTASTANIATVGSHQSNIGFGGSDLFLAKFNSLGVRIWSTYYGGNSVENYPSCITDNYGNIFIAGYTLSTNNIASTIDAYQTTLNGSNLDILLAKFSSNGTRLWGTYFGGTGTDTYSALEADNAGNIYLAGTTNSTTGISTSGSFQSSLNGTFDDLFLVKFYNCSSLSLGTIGAISSSPNLNACLLVSKMYSCPIITNADGYQWNVPLGWTIVSGQGTANITIIPNSTSMETLSVKAYNSCGDSTIAATALISVYFSVAPAGISGASIICAGLPSTYTVLNTTGYTYEWTKPSLWSGTSVTNSIALTPPAIGTSGDTLKIRARQTSSGCFSAYVSKAISCQKAPAVPTINVWPDAACKNKLNTFIVDSLLFANTYTWTFPTGWTASAPATNRLINVTPGTTAVLGNITVRGNNTTCGSGAILTQSVLVPVTAPTTPVIITGASSSCSGVNQVYSIATVPTAVYYRWVFPADWVIVSGQGTVSVTVTVGALSGAISVFAANGGNNACESAARTLSVTATTTPVIPAIINGPTSVCINSTYNFNTPAIPGAINYTWTTPTGFSITSGINTTSINISVAATIASSIVLKVRANNGTCSSPEYSHTIIGSSIVPSQPGTISGQTTLCANSTQSYSVATVPNAITYTWTFPSGWVPFGSDSLNNRNVVAGSATGNITVVAKNGACSSPSRTLTIGTVTASPAQVGSIGATGNICSGKQTTFSVANVAGATSYIWSLPSGWSGSSTTSSIAITTNSTSDSLTVTASNGTCNSVPRKQYIIVNNTPTQPGSIIGSSSACISSLITFIIPRQVGVSSYTWSYPTGWAINSGGNDTFVVLIPSVSGDVNVVANNNGCSSPMRTLATTINTNLPATPTFIVSKSNVCLGVNADFEVSPVTNALSYTWSVPADWTITSGQSTLAIKVMPGSTIGQIKVKAVNGSCASSDRVINIANILSIPETPAAITGQVNPCIGTTNTYSVTPVSGAINYFWESPTGWTINNPTGISTGILVVNQSGAITVRANNGGCFGLPSSLSISAITTPLINSIKGEAYVKAYSVRTYEVPLLAATSYNWTIPSGWSVLSGAGQNKLNVLTGIGSGIITVSGTNSCGQSIPVNLQVFTGLAAGFEDNSWINDYQVFPQPASDFVKLSFTPLQKIENAKLSLFTITGVEVYSQSLQDLQSGNKLEIKISTSEIASGIYMLKFENNNFNQTNKIIINH